MSECLHLLQVISNPTQEGKESFPHIVRNYSCWLSRRRASTERRQPSGHSDTTRVVYKYHIWHAYFTVIYDMDICTITTNMFICTEMHGDLHCIWHLTCNSIYNVQTNNACCWCLVLFWWRSFWYRQSIPSQQYIFRRAEDDIKHTCMLASRAMSIEVCSLQFGVPINFNQLSKSFKIR